MPCANILRETTVVHSPRVMQVEGIFDVPPSERSRESWTVNLPLEVQSWNIGLIVGPSGCGKSTIARELFGQAVCTGFDWPEDQSILDGFPEMSIKEITEILSSVGFSSPPLWLRPFRVLSTGQQMRVTIARLLAEQKDLAVMDEFTSVVDRTVAQIGSAAIAKTVRRRQQKFIAVTCHYDVADWLQPDWIYQPHTNEFGWRSLQRRPAIELEISRVHHQAWELFKSYHYLSSALNKSAVCFCAFWNDVPVAFSALLHFPHSKMHNVKREHRTVCLPDYQGVGIGNALSAWVGALCRGLEYRYQSQTTNPQMVRARLARPKLWRCLSLPTIDKPRAGRSSHPAHVWTRKIRMRLIASFEFIGPALKSEEARQIWSARPIGNPARARRGQFGFGDVQNAEIG